MFLKPSVINRSAQTMAVLMVIVWTLLVGCESKTDAGKANAVSSGNPPAFAAVTTQRIIESSAEEEWLSHGGTYDEQRHSRLHQINRDTVKDLGVAWTYELSTNRGVEATPIVVDGVMYVTSAWSVLHALDAKTGAELWVYDPAVDKAVGAKACCDVVNRGVAVFDGKLFLGVIDGRLEAIDAKTGDLIWSKVTVDQSKPYTITGAPRVVNGKVLIGNGGAELGVRGYLTAYDAETGKKIWRFYTVPNPKKAPDNEISDEILETTANATWGNEGAWVTDGGGGTVWDSIVYDTVHDQIIFGVGNGSPWNQTFRDPAGGDNLFLSSIVAVDADTGRYRWHYQTTPGDNWDYTATQTIILADLPLGVDGKTIRVAMQAPKNGFFYVVNAENGEFISGAPFGPMNWATGLDENGRPIESLAARYGETPVPILPGAMGAHNWQPMAYNPNLQLAYIPAQEIPQAFAEDPHFATRKTGWNTANDFGASGPPILTTAERRAVRATLKGRLLAWDPKTQSARWSVEHNNAWNGGILSTAGQLVFQGQLEGEFAAYDAATGELLWSDDLHSGAASGPATYEIDGEQYVAITTGWGSLYAIAAGLGYDEVVPPMLGRVVTFKLGGTGFIPEPDMPAIERRAATDAFGTESQVIAGSADFARNCAVCHGPSAISSGVLPDLRWSPFAASEDAWNAVVLEGSLARNGMVSFAEYLTKEQANNLRAYVIAQAKATEAEAEAEAEALE